MEDFRILKNGVLEIIPSETSSKNDFDFYVGKRKIKNRKLKDRLCNCTEWIEFDALQEMQLIINGLGNTDDFIAEFDGEPFEGRTIRLFNPRTKLWSMYWTDSNTGVLQPPTVGSFNENIGKFYAKDSFNQQDIIVMFVWDKSNVKNPVWSQAFSIDNGNTWEYNWYMYMSKHVNN